MMTTFEGKEGVSTYTAIVLSKGLRLYAKTGMKPNRAWTPTRMLRKAEEITGHSFKRGEYLKAADSLEAWVKRFGTTGTERAGIEPHPWMQSIRPDEIAECWDGVDEDLYRALWDCMKHAKGLGGIDVEDCGPDDLRGHDSMAKLWKHLPEHHQEAVNRLAAEREARHG